MMETEKLKKLLDKHFKSIEIIQLISAFDLLPDVSFWIKDKNSRLIYGNQHFLEHLGVKCIDHIYGKTDYDFSPYHLANQYVADDKNVMNGAVVTDRMEMNLLPDGTIAWFSTSKKAMIDQHGCVIGSYGVTRNLDDTVKTLSGIEQLRVPVDYIRQYYASDITIEQLAELTYLSVSALERRFKKYLSKTPVQFLRDIRLENARKLLVETQTPIADVAYQCGFKDHSYFSRHFKLMFNCLPSVFREQHRVN